MGFDDKAETVPVKSQKHKKKFGSGKAGDTDSVQWAGFRFQDYTKGGKDVVHIHDDNPRPEHGSKPLVFVWEDVASFRNAIKNFLNERHHIKDSFVVFRGKKADPGGGRMAADFVWTYDRSTNSWKMSLEPAGCHADIEYSSDPAIDFITDWNMQIG